jgi:hypothetical protein
MNFDGSSDHRHAMEMMEASPYDICLYRYMYTVTYKIKPNTGRYWYTVV